MPALSEISPAVTTPGPLALTVSRLGPSTSMRMATPLRLSTMSVIFAHPGHRRELVQHVVHLHGGDGRPLQRRQQHAAKRVAERQAEAALERLGHDHRL